jgi:hypothetical protein
MDVLGNALFQNRKQLEQDFDIADLVDLGPMFPLFLAQFLGDTPFVGNP